MTTFMVGDMVVVSGGRWRSRDHLATVEKVTQHRVTVEGVVYARATGLGPARRAADFGVTRKRIRPATQADIDQEREKTRRDKLIAKLQGTDWNELTTEMLETVAALVTHQPIMGRPPDEEG